MAERRKYLSVNIPVRLIERVDRFVEVNDKGVMSRDEAARRAIVEMLERWDAAHPLARTDFVKEGRA